MASGPRGLPARGAAAGISGLNRYTDVRGLPELRDAIAARASAQTGVSVARANVLVTGGATAGLMAAVAALVAPGEEVLLLGPRWPLIEGHVRLAGATPVEVPLFMGDLSPDGAAAAVSARITEKTVAIYVNTPSNPTGRVLSPETVGALARGAREANLWLVADEVYEVYAYAGAHRPAYAPRPSARSRRIRSRRHGASREPAAVGSSGRRRRSRRS